MFPPQTPPTPRSPLPVSPVIFFSSAFSFLCTVLVLVMFGFSGLKKVIRMMMVMKVSKMVAAMHEARFARPEGGGGGGGRRLACRVHLELFSRIAISLLQPSYPPPPTD
ncbi:hypothetical protein L6452_22651 [Arctium lappa]|uniref:Uncharacterized protein n=1 Tax=Arctium lappa TaxID=4217 RepID=A0ACB9B192_ARCLA|nr:hypothetical protein L6452_22651 [Arctium lappa]